MNRMDYASGRHSPPLAVSRRSAESPRAALVLLHGFSQNASCWGALGEDLANDHEVIAVDAPGHGRSGHDAASLWEAAALTTKAAGRGVYIGYSMGGRVALHAALAAPDLIQGLVLIGAHPGMAVPADRLARRESDAALAERLRTEPLQDFVNSWLANPLFAGLDAATRFESERLENRPEGLAASLENCGTGSQEPLWDRLGELTMPVLLITGEDDAKFTELAANMVAAGSDSFESAVVPAAGHSVHLEQPHVTAALVREFVSRCAGP